MKEEGMLSSISVVSVAYRGMEAHLHLYPLCPLTTPAFAAQHHFNFPPHNNKQQQQQPPCQSESSGDTQRARLR